MMAKERRQRAFDGDSRCFVLVAEFSRNRVRAEHGRTTPEHILSTFLDAIDTIIAQVSYMLRDKHRRQNRVVFQLAVFCFLDYGHATAQGSSICHRAERIERKSPRDIESSDCARLEVCYVKYQRLQLSDSCCVE